MAILQTGSLLVVLLLACACGSGDGDETGDFEKAQVRSFATTGCRETEWVAERAHPGGQPGFASWTPPSAAPIQLLQLQGNVVGDPPDEPGFAVRWTESDIVRWERSRVEEFVRLISPPLNPPLQGATRLWMVLRPGKLRRLEVVPSPFLEIDPRLRGYRTLQFTLDEPSSADASVVITADLETVLTENWRDDGRPFLPLLRLELALPAEAADGVRIEEIRIEGPGARYASAAAGTLDAELDGVLHPAWYVHGGRSVRIPVAVPEGRPELRWYDGSLDGGARRVRVHDDAGLHELAALEGAGTSWSHHSVSFERWRGRKVEIELSADGRGIAFFGVPRIVQPVQQPSTPNVILYMIDTLRADHLGAYGSDVPGVSPNLDRLAAEGAQFGFAISSSPWTKPAIPTLMTGLWPTTHRVGASTFSDQLPAPVPMLQERFRDAGWRTGSFSASPLGSTLSGLERGFDTSFLPGHWRSQLGSLRHAAADQLQEATIAWVEEEPELPFFAYIHTLEVHSWRGERYREPPQGYRSYDYAVKDNDDKLSELLIALEKRGLLDDTLLVVLSDHGESFGDHGVRNHGTSLYQSQIHIPLLFWADGDIPAITVNDAVGLADVAPTLIDLFGLEPLEDADGRSLVPYLKGASEPVHRSVPSARIRYVWRPHDAEIYAMLRQDRKKLVRKGNLEESFDLAEDPCEGRTSDKVPLELRESLDDWLAAEREAGAAFEARYGRQQGSVDAADVERLKSLGYLR